MSPITLDRCITLDRYIPGSVYHPGSIYSVVSPWIDIFSVSAIITLDRYIQCTCYHHPGSYHPGSSCHSGSCHPGSTVTSRSTNHRTHMKTSRGIYGYLIFTPGKRLHHLLSIQTVQLFGSIIIKVLGFCTFPLDCSAEPNLHGSMYLR